MNNNLKLKEWAKDLRRRVNSRYIEIFLESDGVCENIDLDGGLRFVDSLTNQSDAIYSDTMFMRASDLVFGQYEVFHIQTKSFGPMSVFVAPLAVNKVRMVAVIYFDELDQIPEAILHELNETQVMKDV